MSEAHPGNVIRDQIGGRAFFMLGAKGLMLTDSGLQFRIGKNGKGVTHVTIELDAGEDLYTVKFSRVRGHDAVTLCEVRGVAVAELHKTLERETSMRVSL